MRRIQAASESAWLVTRLGIARWSSQRSYSQLQIAAALRVSCQARWYAQAHNNLLSWLQNGGFAQEDGSIAPKHAAEPVPASYAAPASDPAAAAPRESAIGASVPTDEVGEEIGCFS